MTRDEINEIAALVNGVEERLSARITDVEERLSARIGDVETKLLTAFHEWASPVEQRQRSQREAIRALDLEYEALKTRVEKLERERDAA
jgi:hypothetical protein